jgi:hypothetical protein
MTESLAQIERSVRKASSVVMARYSGIDIHATDITLFNYLLQRAYDEIEPGAVHRIPVRDVLAYCRFDRVGRLQENLERLGRAIVEIDYEEADGEGRTLFAHWLSYDISRTERGLLHFAFDPILAHFLREPKVYAAINPGRTRDLGGVANIRLYEAMKLQYNKKHAVQSFTVDELRDFLRVGDAHSRADNFRKFVDKTVSQVNAVSEFDIEVEYTRGGQGGALVGVTFRAVSKTHSKLIEARSVKSVGKRLRAPADTETVDLLDGKNFRERGGPADLSQVAIDKARERMGEDDDVSHLVAEWRESMRGYSMADPDGHFEAWLDMRLKREEDPLLRDIDSDVFGAILGGTGD